MTSERFPGDDEMRDQARSYLIQALLGLGGLVVSGSLFQIVGSFRQWAETRRHRRKLLAEYSAAQFADEDAGPREEVRDEAPAEEAGEEVCPSTKLTSVPDEPQGIGLLRCERLPHVTGWHTREQRDGSTALWLDGEPGVSAGPGRGREPWPIDGTRRD